MNMPVETLTDPIAGHAQALIAHIGEDPHRAGLADTPRRFAAALIEPKGVVVLAEARHLCMAMRGVEKQRSATATRALRGVYAHDAMARQEVVSMMMG